MANWKYSLKLEDIRKSLVDADDAAIIEGGKEIARRIRALNVSPEDVTLGGMDLDLDEIIESFESITDPAEDDFEDMPVTDAFNGSLTLLYDWGDLEVAPLGAWPRNKLCWVGWAFNGG